MPAQRREALHRRGARPRHQGDDARTGWPSAASRCTCCRRPRRSRRCSRSRPDGLFFSNGPGDPAATDRPGRAAAGRAGARTARTSGSASATSSSAARSGFGTYKLKYGHRGINQPVHGPHHRQGRGHRAQPRLRGRRAARRARPRRRTATATVSHVCLNDDVVEGLELRDDDGRLKALLGPVPPRGRGRPARRGLPLRPVRRADGRGAADAEARRHQVASWSSAPGRSSSARPASSTTPAPRPAGCSRTRASGSSWSTPTRPRS